MNNKDLILSLRDQIPYLKNNCFLNFAATCPVPISAIEKMNSELHKMQEPLGNHFYQSLNQIEIIRRDLADFIGAHPSEIAFTQNTSSAISTIALSLKLQPGDVVLTPDNEFPANDYPWRNLSQFGVIHRTFHIKENESIEITLSKLDLHQVKVISISAVSYETGIRIDLKKFANFCQQHQILSVVDAIQALGTFPIHCHQLGIDFLASGSQKWLLGPVGCGFIFAKKQYLQKLFVPMVGWTSHLFPEYFDVQNLEFSNEMTRFEPGLPNYLPIIGMGESLRYLKEVGIEKIAQYIEQKINYLIPRIKEIGFQISTQTTDLQSAFICVYFPDQIDHRQVQKFFATRNISVTVRNNYIRIAPHFFTLESELDLVIKACKELWLEIPELHNKKNQSLHGLNNTKSLHIQSPNFIQTNKNEELIPSPILINGATGNLGQSLAKLIVQNGYKVALIGHSHEKLAKLEQELCHIQKDSVIKSLSLDFNKNNWHDIFISAMNSITFSGLINCSGQLSSDLLINMDMNSIKKQFEIQFFAPTQLIKDVMCMKSNKDFFGILNVVSSSGRCGYPLLSIYGAAHASLWTLSESIEREVGTQISIKTFVADSMHSPLQKLMGRSALRYYRIDKGNFDYLITEDVALDIIRMFFSDRTFHVSRSNYFKLILNAILPSFFTQQIRKVWSLK